MFSLFNKKTIPRPSIYEIPRLDQAGLETEWLQTKAELIRTNCDRWENTYATIFSRANETLPRLLAPYAQIFDPSEIKIGKYLKYSEALGNSVFLDNGHFEKEFGPKGCLAMSFYLYCGWFARSNSRVVVDRDWTRKHVNRLIQEKKPLAFLLKGIILKHGFTFPSPPDVHRARLYLLEAEKLNVAEAKIELASLGDYIKLAELKPANSINDTWP